MLLRINILVTKKCYFNWLEKYLFNEDGKPIETDKSTVLFGTKVYLIEDFSHIKI